MAKDWSLELDPKGNPAYNAGLPVSINRFVAGIVLEDIAKNNATVRAATPGALGHYTKEAYGQNYACMEGSDGTLGAENSYDYNGGVGYGGYGPDPAHVPKLCPALRAENDKHLPEALARFVKSGGLACFKVDPEVAAPAQALAQTAAASIQQLNADSVARGRELVKADAKGKCVTCHSSGSGRGLPADLRFVPNEKDNQNQRDESAAVLKARIKEKDFIGQLRENVRPNGSMPPGGSMLTRQDGEDIQAYIESLAHP